MKKSNLKNHVQFENDQVCIFTTTLSHSQPLALEGSSHILVGLTEGQLQQIEEGGDLRIVNILPQQAYWLGQFKICSYQKPLDVMIIEMKKPKDRLLPSIPIY